MIDESHVLLGSVVILAIIFSGLSFRKKKNSVFSMQHVENNFPVKDLQLDESNLNNISFETTDLVMLLPSSGHCKVFREGSVLYSGLESEISNIRMKIKNA